MATLGGRSGATLSAGEWQRALLARALVVDPDLLLLDEPCVGLDLAQRAHFLRHLDRVLEGPHAPTCVMVTHHLEEVPSAVSHAALLRGGRVTAAGPLAVALTSTTLSATYGVAVEVARDATGRLRSTAPG
jgi:iron complex transport system ATP-binding protein